MQNAVENTDFPKELERYFWDQPDGRPDWPQARTAVVLRLLQEGGLAAVRWLRSTVGEEEVRRVLYRRQGRGISPPRLRFWGLILDLPREDVDQWIARQREDVWHGRTRS